MGTFIDWGVTSQMEFSDMFGMRPVIGTGITVQLQMPFVSVLRLDYGYGFYNGKQIDRAFHLAVGHQL